VDGSHRNSSKFTDHLKILTDREDELLQQLAGLTKEGFLKTQEEWEKSVFAWGASPLIQPPLFVCPAFASFYAPLLMFHASPPTPYTERRKEKVKNESEAGAASASTPSESADAAHPDDNAGSGVDDDNTHTDCDRTLPNGGAGAGTDGGGPGADGDNVPGTSIADETQDAHPPAQKYPLTGAMKVIV
jgi:hypothetical protein